jgi:vacuolar-type H+-ATPase subunit E/Vma4
MGRQELTAALLLQSEQRARMIWVDVEADVADEECRIRELQRQRISALRCSCRSQRAVTVRSMQQQTDSRVAAERHLGRQRLAHLARDLAVELLRELLLREPAENLFARLAAELPHGDWQEIRVRPEDAAVAAKRFPGAQVVTEAQILGGLVALTEEGRIEIDNRLETRLDAAWKTLLTDLLQRLRQEYEAAHDPA